LFYVEKILFYPFKLKNLNKKVFFILYWKHRIFFLWTYSIHTIKLQIPYWKNKIFLYLYGEFWKWLTTNKKIYEKRGFWLGKNTFEKIKISTGLLGSRIDRVWSFFVLTGLSFYLDRFSRRIDQSSRPEFNNYG